jgi:hypothetical protein
MIGLTNQNSVTMKRQPDKIFREKLEGFRKTAPASVWEKIESKLDKKNNNGLWFRIAAAVTLLVTAVTLVLINQSPQTAQLADSVQKTGNESQRIGVTPPDTIIVEDELTTIAKEKTSSRRVRQKTTDKPGRRHEQTHTAVPDNSIALTDETNPVETIAEDPQTAPATIVAEKETVEQKKAAGIMLIYSAEEVNEKYLDKKSLAQATEDDKKQSTLRKLLDKAYDLKHNQDPLGDLRQKKNEILALNFKNDKQRSQNR